MASGSGLQKGVCRICFTGLKRTNDMPCGMIHQHKWPIQNQVMSYLPAKKLLCASFHYRFLASADFPVSLWLIANSSGIIKRVNLTYPGWMWDASQRLGRGFILLIFATIMLMVIVTSNGNGNLNRMNFDLKIIGTVKLFSALYGAKSRVLWWLWIDLRPRGSLYCVIMDVIAVSVDLIFHKRSVAHKRSDSTPTLPLAHGHSVSQQNLFFF